VKAKAEIQNDQTAGGVKVLTGLNQDGQLQDVRLMTRQLVSANSQ
jgi:hypothetical protein